MTNVAVIYYSSTGNVHALADALAQGAAAAGAQVRLRKVAELAPAEAIDSNPAWRAHLDATVDVPEATHDDLRWADAYAFGTPARYGNVSSQLKQFLDTTAPLWAAGELADKPATAFTSAINRYGGNESTLLALYNSMHHWGAIVVAPGYTQQAFAAAGGKSLRHRAPLGRRTPGRGAARRRAPSGSAAGPSRRPAARGRPRHRRFVEMSRRRLPEIRVLALLGVAELMLTLDLSIVNVALPSIRADLGFSPSSLQWVVNGYALTFAGFLLLGGRMADVFGGRRVFLGALSAFTGASLACGVATGEATLVGARVAQGLSAGVLAPTTLSILTATYREPETRARALAIWTAAAIGGGAVGGLLGGLLTDALSWRWIFFVNVPVGAALLALATRRLPRTATDDADRELDIAGAVMATGGLTALVWGSSALARRAGARPRPSPASRSPRSCWVPSRWSRSGSPARRSCRSRSSDRDCCRRGTCSAS